jgi:tetratricopeptide (TPR) repeat protein
VKKHAVVGLLYCLVLGISGCGFFVSAEDHIQRASKAKDSGDYGLAAIELRNALQSAPENIPAHIKLVEVLLLQSEVTLADNEVQQLRKLNITSDSLKSDVADIIARVMIAKRDFAGLLTANQAGELPLADSTAQLRQAQAMLGLGRAAEARDALLAFLERYPNNDEAHFYYAQALASTGQESGVLERIDAILKRSPTYANAWVAKGVWQTRHGMPVEATQSFTQAEEHAAGQLTRAEEATLLSLLIDGLLSQGRIQDAEHQQQRLVTLVPNAPVTQLVAARLAIAKEDYATAVGLLQKIVLAQPDFASAQVLLGGAMAAQGNLRQAEAELEKLIAKEGVNLEGRKVLAEVELRLEQSARAIEVLAPIIAMAQSDNQIATLATKAQMAVANSPENLTRLIASQKREPANEPLRLLTAGALMYARKPDQAYALVSSPAEGQFDIRRIPLLLNAAAASKGVAAARAEADRIAAANPNDERHLATLGLFFASYGDYATARHWFDRALSKVRVKQAAAVVADNPTDRPMLAPDKDAVALQVGELGLIKLLGVMDVHLGNKTAALDGVRAYRQKHPEDLSAVMVEGDILLEMRDFQGAAAVYETVVNKAPNQSAVIALYRARRFAGLQTANAPLEQWLKTHDGDVAVRMLLAESYQASGDSASAITHFERVVALQPANAAALNNLAVLYQNKGDKRAEETGLQAFKRANKSPEVADTYGWILLENGKVSEGAKILATAAAAAPKNPDIQFHNAVAIAKTGDVAGGRKKLQEVLAQYPKFSTRAEAEKALADMGNQ